MIHRSSVWAQRGTTRPAAFPELFWNYLEFPGGSDGKESSCNVGDLGSIPGLGRSAGGGKGYPLQYSRLKSLCGQRSLVGYSPGGRKESVTTEQLSLQHGKQCRLPGGTGGKECLPRRRHRRLRCDPWSRQGQPSPVFLPGKSHGQRSLAGYSWSPWGANSQTRLSPHTAREAVGSLLSSGSLVNAYKSKQPPGWRRPGGSKWFLTSGPSLCRLMAHFRTLELYEE